MSAGWNLNDATTSLPPFFFFFFPQQNDCTAPKCGELSEYTDSANTELVDPSSSCMKASDEYDRCDAGTAQDTFILPAPPVGGLPICCCYFQLWICFCHLN